LSKQKEELSVYKSFLVFGLRCQRKQLQTSPSTVGGYREMRTTEEIAETSIQGAAKKNDPTPKM